MSAMASAASPGKRLPPMLMSDIPNIPGMRRDLNANHPMLVKQYNINHSASNLNSNSAANSAHNSPSRMSQGNSHFGDDYSEFTDNNCDNLGNNANDANNAGRGLSYSPIRNQAVWSGNNKSSQNSQKSNGSSPHLSPKNLSHNSSQNNSPIRGNAGGFGGAGGGGGGDYGGGGGMGGGGGEDKFQFGDNFYSPLRSSQEIKDLTLSIQSFPTQAESYNDLSGRYSLRSQQIDRALNVKALPYSNLESVPHFVANGKEPVCRVLAFYTEKVPNNGIEQERARKMEIIFFLEDSTIEIIEPYIPNCGIVQGRMLRPQRILQADSQITLHIYPLLGRMLRRHSVAKPPTYRKRQDVGSDGSGIKQCEEEDVEYYTITDVYAGAKLQIYQKDFTIMDCDASTKQLLAEHGTPFGDPLSAPNSLYDPRILHSQAVQAKQKLIKSRSPKKSTGFFEYDRKVLRFYGIWDTSSQLFGDSLRVRLHYYLADNTMEVLPIQGPSEGRDKVPKYLKKSMVMIKEENMSDTNGTLPSCDASTSSSTFPGMEPEIAGPDALVPNRPYHWTDLQVGQTISVAALNITIVDADGFTREFYESKQMPLLAAISVTAPVYPEIDNSVPPHNGFGSDADSIQTCKGSLQPKPIRKDEARLRKFQGMILRFFSTISNPKSEDAERTFIISLYLEDDSITISEPPIRNSGHKGGIFLSRTGLVESTHGQIRPFHFYVGAVIEMFSHKFLIHDADEYTQRYMGDNSFIWEYSNIDNVIDTLLKRKEVLQRVILTSIPASVLSTQVVDKVELDAMFRKAGIFLNKQEIVTLFRTLDTNKLETVKLSKILKYLI